MSNVESKPKEEESWFEICDDIMGAIGDATKALYEIVSSSSDVKDGNLTAEPINLSDRLNQNLRDIRYGVRLLHLGISKIKNKF